MLVDTKARVGVFAIALGAYLPQFPSLVPEFKGQYAASPPPRSLQCRPGTSSARRTSTW